MRLFVMNLKEGKAKPKYGWMLGDKVGEIGGNVFGRYRRKDAETPLADVRLFAPSEPSKIVCVGRNYVEHAKELGNEVPKVPLIFYEAAFLHHQPGGYDHPAAAVCAGGA